MRRLLPVLAVVLLAWGVVVLLTGGVDWTIAGHAIRSRAPDRAFLLGVALLIAQAIAYRDTFARDCARAATRVRPALPAVAVAGALSLLAYAMHFGSFTAGGADSFGYVSQAHLWARGALPAPQPILIAVPWPSADESLAPLGYRAGPRPRTVVPKYAPGLPLLMAAAAVAGACGPFLVVPLCAAAVVWFAFVLGRRTAGGWAGLLAALFVATSPIVLFMSTAPMSDIPAAAIWTAAACAALGGRRRDAVACGALAAAGLLVRPNLPIVPVILLGHIAWLTPGRERWARVAGFLLPVAIAAAALALLNSAWYGAPWKSGYGDAEQLFAVTNIAPNLSRYLGWLWLTQSPLVLLALLPLVPPFHRDSHAAAVRLCAALFVGTLCSYLVYLRFDDWWYLRFLVPAMPALLVLVAAAIVTLRRRLAGPWGPIAALAAVLLILVLTARFSHARIHPGILQDAERRYVDAGAFVQRALPSNAVVFTVQHSGSVRYYGGRLTIRWDLIDPDWTARAPADVERLGRHPYLLVEDFELPEFRQRFGFAPGAPLPWPLLARADDRGGISVFDLASRPAPAGTVRLDRSDAPRCAAPQPLAFDANGRASRP